MQSETNDDKTEALIISSPELSNYVLLQESRQLICCCCCCFVVVVVLCLSAKNLGVTFDMHLTMAARVVNLIRPAKFELHPISSVSHCLSLQATKPLDSTFVLLRLYYCNSLLSEYLLNRLQKVQNSAARLSLKAPRTDHITLHWHQTDTRIKYKMYCLSKDHRMLTSRRATLGRGHVDFEQIRKADRANRFCCFSF